MHARLTAAALSLCLAASLCPSAGHAKDAPVREAQSREVPNREAPARTAPPAAAPSANTPAANAPAGNSSAAKSAKEPTAGQSAARDRQKKCGAEWRGLTDVQKTAQGPKWPQFWSKCNKRLKGTDKA